METKLIVPLKNIEGAKTYKETIEKTKWKIEIHKILTKNTHILKNSLMS